MAERIFLTGVPGWLGTRCVELIASKSAAYQNQSYALRCLVVQGSDTAELQRFGTEIIYGDLRKKESLQGRLKGCRAVVHMAGVIHPKNVCEFYKINYESTRNVLDAAIAEGVKKFIFISSNSPAGFSQKEKPLTENDPPRPYRHYGKSKWLAENLLLEAARKKRIETVILRPCWYYGPRQPERQTRFFRMIKKGSPILFGDGGNLRSLSYIDHVVQAIVLSLEKEGLNGEIFWIADERPYTTLEIYTTVAELLGVETFQPVRLPVLSSWAAEKMDFLIQSLGFYNQEIHVAGEMARNIACSVEKAKKVLGFKPEISLKEGMSRSVDWCRNQGIVL